MRNRFNLSMLCCFTVTMLSLFGCGNDTKKAPAPKGPDAFVAGTHPRFDPLTGDVPFNSDFVFARAAATDGTADIGSPSDPARAALNILDGFSTSAYFDILINGSVDPGTAVPLQTVFLLELSTSGDALDPANITGVAGPAEFDVAVVSLDGGTNNVVRVRPLSPLKPKTKYLVFLTNGLKDTAGQPLTRSWTYNALRDQTYDAFANLAPVRATILGWEQLASGALMAESGGTLSSAAALERLILSYTFTTTDPIAPLMAMAAPRAAIGSLQLQAGVAHATVLANVQGLENAGLLSTPKARPLGLSVFSGVDMGVLSGGRLTGNVGTVYTGFIKLPYYQTTPTGLSFGENLSRHWLPDQVLAGALGVDLPEDLDGSYNLSYRYPFAAKTADETIPLQVTLPQASFVPSYATSGNCGELYATTGYPVVIYIHGITSDRSSVLALGHTLASQCIATVAIDLPLHGIAPTNELVAALNVEQSQLIPYSTLYNNDTPHERHFNIGGSGGAPAPMNFNSSVPSDGSGSHFINLGYLANTRDNNRQAVMDLLNLNASLGSLNDKLLESTGMGINLDQVYVVGVSLGGIVGGVFVSVNQAAIANEADLGLTANLNPVRGLVMSSAGTQVTHILVNSLAFASTINDGLADRGVVVGTSNYERFLYVAQSTLDSADLVNFSPILASQNVPVLVQQINGDPVIPNNASNAPLVGTQALAELLGATQLGNGVAELGRGYVKMTAGGHSSLLRPEDNAPQVTAELQAQVVNLVLNDGTVVVGSVAPDQVEQPSDDN